MSFQLKNKGQLVSSQYSWNAQEFGRLTGASFPVTVEKTFVWEYEDYWLGWVDDPAPIPPTEEQIAEHHAAQMEKLRTEAYRNESDPLFFKYQRGEVDKQVWLDKVQEIKDRYQ